MFELDAQRFWFLSFCVSKGGWGRAARRAPHGTLAMLANYVCAKSKYKTSDRLRERLSELLEVLLGELLFALSAHAKFDRLSVLLIRRRSFLCKADYVPAISDRQRL